MIIDLNLQHMTHVTYALDEYRARWFDMYIQSIGTDGEAANKMVYDSICKAQEVINEQYD